MAYRKADGTIDPCGFDPGLEHRVKRLEDGWHPTAFKAEYPPKVDWVSLDDFMHLKKMFDKQVKRIAELEALLKMHDNAEHYDALVKCEAENKRLREALESIQTNPDYTNPEYMVRIARKALEEIE